MINCKYFDIKDGSKLTEDLLKLLWRKIVIKLHPDKGGSEEDFKQAQNEYESLLQQVGAGFTAKFDSPDNYDNWEDFLADVSPTVKECLIRTREAGAKDLEICGRWIWVTLAKSEIETREKLKAIDVDGKKYCFSGKKKMWYWAGVKCRSRKNHSMDYIRGMYGSENYRAKDEDKQRQIRQAA